MNTINKAQPTVQFSATETESTNILGPVIFSLDNLQVAGKAGLTNLPSQIAPGQSPYIIGSDEQFSVSVDIVFNETPLTKLLLCLGTKLGVTFAFEGIGGQATEIDLTVAKKTQAGVFTYTLTYEGTPEGANLTPGLYAIAAVASIGPVDHPCAQAVLGYGYIAGRLMQVYPA